MKPKRKRFIPSKAETKNLNICFINPEKVKEQSLAKQEKPTLQITNNWEKLKQVITADTTGPRLHVKKRNREHQSSSGSAVTPKALSRSGKKRKVVELDSLPRKRRRQSVKTPSTDEISTLAQGPQTIWFDDVDPSLLEYVERSSLDPGTGSVAAQEGVKMNGTESELVKPASFEGLTKAVAMDCEMVGIGSGSNHSMLARVSIVNSFGHCIYDTFVRPAEKVTDYRTAVSGVRPSDVKNAPSFEEVQKKVYAIVDQRILVGHALRNDLQVLYLSHPRKMIRDTARYKEFRKLFQGRTPSLKNLSDKVLGVRIQSGEHNSVEDARAAMRLYTMYKVQWEKQLSRNKHRDRTSSKRDEDGDKT